MAFSFNKICSNVIPVGKYKVKVTDPKFKTKATGETSHDIICRYVILEGPHANRSVIDTIYEKAFSFRLKPWLQACGIDCNREFATQEELYEYAMKQANGKTIMIDVIVSPYNGIDYNKVQNFYPLPGSKTSAADALAEFGVKPTVKASTEPKVEVKDDESIIKDDDLPF